MLEPQIIIKSLIRLREHIDAYGLPAQVLKNSVDENPWFTSYYIETGLRAILTWLDTETLTNFLEKYPVGSRQAKVVGVIAAGNIPFVGFHDLLVSVLCGHTVQFKPSHQDRVLMEWLISNWQVVLPDLVRRIKICDHPAKVDILLASGSNATARALDHTFSGIPKVLRKNRFSIAWLDNELSDEDIERLSQDILLYNGMGCRNISNIVCSNNFDFGRWIRLLNRYEIRNINPHYIEKVQIERVRFQMKNVHYLNSEFVLVLQGDGPVSTPMGVVNCIIVNEKSDFEKLVLQYSQEIQAVANQGTDFGTLQYPKLDEFADGIDTMKLLSNM